MQDIKYHIAKVGNINIGKGHPIVVQSMCNTHTNDIIATTNQCIDLYNAGARLVRLTVPGLKDVDAVKQIKQEIKLRGYNIPLVADIHFSSTTAIAVAPFVEKVRINPGNFHKDHAKACEEFLKLITICKEYGTAIRIGINHGSLGERITSVYGNTYEGMCKAALEWIDLCVKYNFYNFVISLKASNTLVMVMAYRALWQEMLNRKEVFPIHLGVTEAGNGDAGRIKSCVGISALLQEGIGNTIRVSLTEPPINELPTATYLANRYNGNITTCLKTKVLENKTITATYHAKTKETLLLDCACDFGSQLLDKQIDDLKIIGYYKDNNGNKVDLTISRFGKYITDEMLQACRRKFYRPEYIACPGCGRTMYNLEKAFEEVKEKTKHFNNIIIAVMGCIVNGPGEMADATWGYVGEGKGKVTIYKGKQIVLSHIPEEEAVDTLVKLIEQDIIY